jgi:hypothetical protein
VNRALLFASAALLLEPVSPSSFCVTSGRVSATGTSMHVETAGMRGVAAGSAGSRAELAFTYRGPSRSDTPLANGEVRRQIGLKLRAQDTCNVVYVMMHVEPTPRVAVSVKRNAAKHTHAQCLDAGYINLAAAKPVPAVVRDVPHVLSAEIDGRTLRVLADGAVVWEGVLPEAAFAFDGPSGVRSDNGTFDFELRVPAAVRPGATCPLRD